MRHATLLAFALLAAAALTGCPAPTYVCSPTTCAGCCDSVGTCQPGTTFAACGKEGIACGTCPQGLDCSTGVCGAGAVDAGSGGAGGAGGNGGTGGTGTLRCTTGLVPCNGVCRDPRADNANCGGCGITCSADKFCSNGACRALPTSCASTPCPAGYYCEPSQRVCLDGCRASSDCGSTGKQCVGARCVCPTGTNACGSTCAPLDSAVTCGASCQACNAITNAVGQCRNGACEYTCNAGSHLCNGRCVSNSDVATCGSACQPCSTPPNGVAVCTNEQCDFACNVGYHRCGNECVSNDDVATCGTRCTACTAPAGTTPICMGGQCDFICPTGTHRCGTQCVSDTSINSCGTSCTACPTAPNAQATCDGTRCGLECLSGSHSCGSTCASDLSPSSCGSRCTACPAPSNGTATCDGVNCGTTCNTGFHDCSGQCLSNTSANSCGTRCMPCPAGPANSQTTCTNGACGWSCLSGFNACNGQCVASSIAACGTACAVCTAPDGGTPTCNGSTCGFTCSPGTHRCGNACLPDDGVDSCGTACTPCADGPPGSTRACRPFGATFTCGWDCAPGTNRCPQTGTAAICAPSDYNRACGLTCSVCSSAAANERGVCQTNGLCGTDCVAAPDGGTSRCGGNCVNTRTNVAHCGACGVTCGAGERCVAGACKPSCAAGPAFAELTTGFSWSGTGAPLAVADLNGDGVNDLLVADSSGNVYRYPGAVSADGGALGRFDSSTGGLLATLTSLSQAWVADFTADGRPDVLLISSTGGARVLRQSTTGGFAGYSFTPSSAVSASLSITGVAIADYTGDGVSDALFTFTTASTGQAAALYAGTSAAGNPLPTGVPVAMGVGNLNGVAALQLTADARPDAIATASTNALFVFPGTQDAGAFFDTASAAAGQLPSGETFTSPTLLATGDVTGDGVPDAVVAVATAGFGLRVYPLSRTPSFGASTLLALPAAAQELALADVNGDGVLDVIAVTASGARVFRATGMGGFQPADAFQLTLSSSGRQRLAVSDVTGDGRPELVFLASTASQVVAVLNDGAGRFPALQGVPAPGVDFLAAGDVTGDGLADVVGTPNLGGSSTGTAQLFAGRADGGFTAGATWPVTHGAAAVGRLDADALSDVITFNQVTVDGGSTGGTGQPDIRLGPGGLLEVQVDGGWGTVCDDAFATSDAVVACRQLGQPTTSPTFTSGTSTATGPIWLDDLGCAGTEASLFACSHSGIGIHNCVHSEDVLLTCTPGAATLTWVVEVRRGTASGLGAPTLLTLPGAGQALAIADLDGDGLGDVLVATQAGIGSFRSLPGGGFGPWAAVSSSGTSATALAVADLNGDRRVDVIAANTSVSFPTITAWINLGAGRGFGPGASFSGTSDTSGGTLRALDVNDDGKVDVLLGGRVYLGDGAGDVNVFAPVTLAVRTGRTAVVDADSDGYAELLYTPWSTFGAVGLSVLRGSPTGLSSTVQTLSAGLPVADVAAADTNQDPWPDVVVLQGPSGAGRTLHALTGTCR